MKILIQKFGGTSVSTPERRHRVVEKVLKAREEGYTPVVVVSAMGRKGEPYATDTLLSLLGGDFKNTNLQAVDLLMSCGEIISSVVMCEEFYKAGIQCVPLTGGQAGVLTDDNYGNASVLKVDSEKLLCVLNKGLIPVVSGFQGCSESGYMTTLGRGGSDVTAALLGAALKAVEVEIYTDVDGIMTADPRIVSDAALIEQIGYSEVFQFADQGAKVIHPRAIEIAMNSNITLSIKNTMSDCKGTLINSYNGSNSSTIITGITHMGNRLQVKVSLRDNLKNKNYQALLDRLAENFISIDLINVFPEDKIFTIDSKDKKAFDEIMIRLGLKYTSIDNCSKIAVIGSRMRGIPGVMARIIRALNSEGVEILQTTDSYMTIWCLVESKNTEKAINALHHEFRLGKTEVID